MILGALKAVWPFWVYHYRLVPLKLNQGFELAPIEAVMPDLLSLQVLIATGCFIAGMMVVWGIHWAARPKASNG